MREEMFGFGDGGRIHGHKTFRYLGGFMNVEGMRYSL